MCAICGNHIRDDYLCGVCRAKQWFPARNDIRGMDFLYDSKWIVHVDNPHYPVNPYSYTYDADEDCFVGEQPPWLSQPKIIT
jgi:hypothetical protein